MTRYTESAYRFIPLLNGFIRVEDTRSGLVGLYNADGTYRSGDVRNVGRFVR